MVYRYSNIEEEELNYITINDKKGGYLAGSHFIQKGHKNLAIIYKALHKPSLDIFEGFKKALIVSKFPIKKEYFKKYYNSEL